MKFAAAPSRVFIVLCAIGAIVVAAPFALSAAVIGAGYVFGAPDRIQEARFLNGLHAGMQRSDVAALMRQTGRRTVDGFSARFTTVATLCMAGGDDVEIDYDNGRVRSWSTKTWADGC